MFTWEFYLRRCFGAPPRFAGFSLVTPFCSVFHPPSITGHPAQISARRSRRTKWWAHGAYPSRAARPLAFPLASKPWAHSSGTSRSRAVWSVESGSSGYGTRPAAATQLSQTSSCYRKAAYVRTCSPPPGTRCRARLACRLLSSRHPHQWRLDCRPHCRLAYRVCRCLLRPNWARLPRSRRRPPRPPPRPCHHLHRWRHRAHRPHTIDRPRPHTRNARCQWLPRWESARGRLPPRREAGAEWLERCRPPPSALARGQHLAYPTRRHARCDLRGTRSSLPRCATCPCRGSISPPAACWSTRWPGSSLSRPTRGTSAGRSACSASC